MKKYLLLMLTVGLLVLSACSNGQIEKVSDTNEEFKTISTNDLKEKLNNDSWVLVDTRSSDEFNGWKLNGIKRGGHISGAVDFSANWLRVDVDNKENLLNEALKNKNITQDKNIVLYDSNNKDSLEVAKYLSGKGYNNIYIYDLNEWAEDDSLPMEKYKNYHLIVPPSIVKDILDGKTPETFENANEIKIVEASWGDEDVSYSKGHVPTAFHINTDLVEPPPSWMLGTNEELESFALEYGFTKDDTVIVTSENQMAAYRVAVVLRYIGVKDVRVLNGGLLAWKLAGYEVETTSNKPTPVNDFGATIPANPELITTIEQVKENLTKNEFTLVDNRTWDEHIGNSSGYSYHDKKGRIPGSLYGYAGLSDSNSLDYFRNIDNTMRNFNEILSLWNKSGIDINNHLAFMCGSGWRAAEVLTYAQVMGLENTSLYSDGWIGWSNDTNNPIEVGEPK
ncbi:rhodanese-like domain-containing protein [Alkalithermobacter paradoxus]|uniref:Thiosulfate sulfurtransferase YnjE n=1 Tax=Alkalithermobacter paradoxus TaxID=29349 RepID=A0A1V4I629_9FIRM|nr:thiosulfate sulfurtransferase YnjE precursor [[Clostridium] thermoalcaliphilum]